MASENGVETVGTQESDNDTENDSEEAESSSPEPSTTFHSKSPCEGCENSNVYSTLIMKCPKCFWHDYYKICPICDHHSLGERNYIKEGWKKKIHKNSQSRGLKWLKVSKKKRREEFTGIEEGFN